MRMADVRLQSLAVLWCGLKDPFDIHSSRTAIATVRMRKLVCIFANRMSARRSPAGLTKVSNDIEDGLFIAARAFSNVQSAICHGMEKGLVEQTCVYHDAGMNKQKNDRARPGYLPGTREYGRKRQSMRGCGYCVDVFPSKAEEEMERRRIRSEFIARAQEDSLAGIVIIGRLTQRRRSIGRKWNDVITNKGHSPEKPLAAYKRRS